MADYVSSLDNLITPSASSSGAADDSYEDACSICLDPFNTQDPPTVTNCKHEYHLQCILDWSQRSKECPICWQLLVLKDPASQELLAAVESERNSRSRRISPTAPTIVHNFHEDFEIDHDAPYTNDSDFNERIMRHLAAAASRARYVSRRERQRSSGLGPSQVLVFGPPTNVPDLQQTPTTSPEERQNLGYGLSDDDSPTSSLTSTVSGQPPSSGVPSAVNPVSSTAVNRDGPFKPSHPPPDSPQRLRPSELLAFSESFKSRLSAASTRYKESISKNARGFREKLLARNNSVKELSKGVQREMSAGIAGVARMIERLDPTSKRTGVPVSVPSSTGGTSNISYKGKDVQENVIAQSVDGNNGENAHDMSSDAPSYVSGFIPGRLEVSHAQSGH